jgi:hypothetical protein
MKRILLIALGATALALAVPGAALAHDGHEGHHHHHGRHHHKLHVVHVGKGASGAPGPTENAGKVASYENNVLTVTLGDGSTVTGKVSNFTRIRCLSATPAPVGVEPMDEHGRGDDRGGPGFDGSKGSWNDKGDEGGEGPPPSSEPPCDSSALVSGAVVRAAELGISPSGSVFQGIWIVR